MIPKKEMKISPEEISEKKDDIDDLKQFIQKKKDQNVALKKILAKFNTDENQSINK